LLLFLAIRSAPLLQVQYTSRDIFISFSINNVTIGHDDALEKVTVWSYESGQKKIEKKSDSPFHHPSQIIAMPFLMEKKNTSKKRCRVGTVKGPPNKESSLISQKKTIKPPSQTLSPRHATKHL
jgi:hypothetical protein